MTMILRVAISLILLQMSVLPGLKRNQSACDGTILPADVQDMLKTRFIGWRIKTEDDLEDYHRKLWSENKPQQCPGMTSAHLMNRRDPSFAVVLIPVEVLKKGYKVVVVGREKTDEPYAIVVIEEEGAEQGSGDGVVVYKVPPGLYADAEGGRKVRLDLDGIQVEEMEKGSTLYFWRNRRFEHLLTSE